MTSNDDFEAYLDVCERIATRLYEEGIWPWSEEDSDGHQRVDSTKKDNLVESDSKSKNL